MNSGSKDLKKGFNGGSFKYTTPDGICLIIGTENKNDCRGIYIQISGWVTTSIVLTELVKAFKRRLRSQQYYLTYGSFGSSLGSYFSSFESAETAVHTKAGSTTYFSFETTLMASSHWDWKNKEFQAQLKAYGLELYNVLQSVEVDFIFTPRSK